MTDDLVQGPDPVPLPPPQLRVNPDESLIRFESPYRAAPLIVGAYIVTLGLYEFWRQVTLFAITNKRLISRKGLIFTKTEQSLPLHFVQDATIKHVFWWASITVSTAGGPSALSTLGPLSNRSARLFKNELLAAAQQARSSNRSELG